MLPWLSCLHAEPLFEVAGVAGEMCFNQAKPAASYSRAAGPNLVPRLTLYKDRRCYSVFHSAPDLIRSLLPGTAAAGNVSLDPIAPGDRLSSYCFAEVSRL